MNALYIQSFPLAIALALGGGALLLRGFGPQYATAFEVLQLLAFGTLIFLGAPAVGALLVEGLEREVSLISTMAMAVLFGAALLLIPRLGFAGAALASLLALLVGKAGHAVLYARLRLRIIPTGLGSAVLGIAVWAVAVFAIPRPLNALSPRYRRRRLPHCHVAPTVEDPLQLSAAQHLPSHGEAGDQP